MKLSWISAACVAAVCVGLLPCELARAENIVANFTDGDGVSSADSYLGMAGAGWQDAWVPATSRIASSAVEVLDSTETVKGYQELKPGSDSYLDMVFTAGATGTSSARYTVNRDYVGDDLTYLDPAAPHMVKFTVRINENLGEGTTFDNWDKDTYFIADLPAASTSTSGAMRWGVVLHGGQQVGSSVAPREWRFVDSVGGSSFPLGQGTGMVAATGVAYDFTITVYPDTDQEHGLWDATISDGVNSYSKSDMTWRSTASGIGGVLCFGAWANTEGEVRDWSIDNIQISQVPEPSAGVLALFGALCVVVMRRRVR